MLFKKQGFPEEGELVICTVTKIQFNSIFVKLDEYEKGGMIHISEISPGRIRNIRDFVREGKVIICKVLNINKERGHIDLSLRRVTEIQRRNMSDEIKLEQKSEKIIENIARPINKEFKELYHEVSEPILKKYPNVHSCFQDVVAGDVSLESLGIQKKIAKELTDAIMQKMVPKEVELKGFFKIRSYLPNGADVIKNILLSATKDEKGISAKYEGAGKYMVWVKSNDYKSGEKVLDRVTDKVLSDTKKSGCECE